MSSTIPGNTMNTKYVSCSYQLQCNVVFSVKLNLVFCHSLSQINKYKKDQLSWTNLPQKDWKRFSWIKIALECNSKLFRKAQNYKKKHQGYHHILMILEHVHLLQIYWQQLNGLGRKFIEERNLFPKLRSN